MAEASAGASDSAASSLPGVGVAGSSHSYESLVLADPDWWGLPAIQLAGSMAERVYRGLVMSTSCPTHSCVGWLVVSTESYSHYRSSHLSPSWVEILVKSVTVSALGLGDRALAVTRHASPLPACGLVDPG